MLPPMIASTLTLAAMLAMAPSAPAARGNEAHARRRGAVFSVVGSARLGVLLAGGADVIQPVGFGAGFSFRVHGLHIGPIRLGVGADLGHTRFIDRRTVDGSVNGEGETAVRYAALAHSDFGAGPSIQVALGPVFLQGDFTVGVGISTFSRPLGILSIDEEHHSDTSAMIRAGGLIGIPIRNNQGITLGVATQRYFSTYQVIAQPDLSGAPDMVEQEPDTNPFDLALDISLGYLFQF